MAEIINRTNFWDFSFFDLILFILAVLTVSVVLTATVCRHFYKNNHSIAQLREEQRKTGRIAMDYTVKKVQTVRPIKETKIQRPFTGTCVSRRRHSIDIPTTMKVSMKNRNQQVRTVTEKSKRPAPTIPRPVVLSNTSFLMKLWLAISDQYTKSLSKISTARRSWSARRISL